MVGTLVERAWFSLCLIAGRVLRAGRYARTRLVRQDGEMRVRKRRVFFAPVLVWLGGPLMKLLNTGVRVLPQHDWEEREREVYERLHGRSVRVETDGTLVLPCLTGATLATLLEDPQTADADRTRAVEAAVAALARFHGLGFTHGDAMAENVMIDLDAGVAHWFDFETVHDAARPPAWRRADDVRALLATCLLRAHAAKRTGTLQLMLRAYGDEEVNRYLGASFTSAFRRALVFHLGQAPLSWRCFRDVGRLLGERVA